MSSALMHVWHIIVAFSACCHARFLLKWTCHWNMLHACGLRYECWHRLQLLTAQRPRDFLRSGDITRAARGRPSDRMSVYPNLIVFARALEYLKFRSLRSADESDAWRYVYPPLSFPHLPLAVLCPVGPSTPAVLPFPFAPSIPLPCSLVP